MISSTARDLPEHREQVRLACERNGFEPRWMMEHLTARNEHAVKVSMRMVEEADIYLGILAQRYGTIPTGYEFSITEMEYNRAVELDKPRLIFFIHEDHPMRAADVETGPGAEKLKALKARIGADRVAAFFKSPPELYGHVGDALRNLAAELDNSETRSAGHAADERPRQTASSLPHPRVEDVFVGRQADRDTLAAAIFPTGGARHPVVVSGMPGVGKSYLVDRFFLENGSLLPGGYLRLTLVADYPTSVPDLLATLRDRLKLRVADDALVARLLMPLTLVHVENADNFDAGRVIGELADALPGCPLVVSTRLRDLGFSAGWGQVPLASFDEATALQLLSAELGPDAPAQNTWPALAAALGYLPLALHSAAVHLRTGYGAAAFLRRLRDRNLALGGVDPADPSFRDRSRALLSDTFELSLAALRHEGGAAGASWLAGFSALGHAPAPGFGDSLGAAITGLTNEAFEDMALAAARLSLLDRAPRGNGSAFRLHPLLAELVRPRADKDTAFGRVTEWFIARLPEGGQDQGSRWREIYEEIAAFTEWLAQIPPADRVRVERAGSRHAISNGPYHAWLRFCQEALAGEVGEHERSNILWTLGNVALRGGAPDRALAAAEDKRELDQKRGAEREGALASGLIADILKARGRLDEALRIRCEEELPVYERLPDEREATVVKGKIADILQMRGDLDEALRRRHEVLTIYQRIGDARAAAVTRGKIAEILQARGNLDEALAIYEEMRRLLLERGEVRDAVVARGKIAEILSAKGDLDEALRIFREEVIPVYERLGDADGLLTGRTTLAIIHLRRKREGDQDEARHLLWSALDQARHLRLPEARGIEQIIEQAGLS